ncbi:hypothetical protein [Streptomyces canus]|uniref:hypothetical protein n=1 Tax=Streptomyces canus TaxID=58343 RepID=UPI00371FD676
MSTKYGSVDSLKISDRCGCTPNARQIRDTDDCERPISFAIDRVDHCDFLPAAGKPVEALRKRLGLERNS